MQHKKETDQCIYGLLQFTWRLHLTTAISLRSLCLGEWQREGKAGIDQSNYILCFFTGTRSLNSYWLQRIEIIVDGSTIDISMRRKGRTSSRPHFQVALL
jgi:hypothetical protein